MMEYIITNWGSAGERVVNECAKCVPFNGSVKEFLNNCTACGGDWGNMLLSGVKTLYPNVWNVIPEDMGHNAFFCIVNVLMLLGVDCS